MPQGSATYAQELYLKEVCHAYLGNNAIKGYVIILEQYMTIAISNRQDRGDHSIYYEYLNTWSYKRGDDLAGRRFVRLIRSMFPVQVYCNTHTTVLIRHLHNIE